MSGLGEAITAIESPCGQGLGVDMEGSESQKFSGQAPGPNRGHEAALGEAADHVTILAATNEGEELARAVSDGDGKAAVGFELVDEGIRYAGSGGGHEDSVVGTAVGGAENVRGGQDIHVGDAASRKVPAGEVNERGDALDGYDMAEGQQFAQDRGLIAGAGADLEDALVAAEGQCQGHPSDHGGLRDGLVVADGEGGVFVGAVAEFGRYEEFAGDGPHGVDNRVVSQG